ncbi:hypothetical protein [Chamaesiphon sp. OTE_75_metabat_556]|nr:hypothetical protein [Chamaesiphon sp. OTE_75_metabat_556]
MAPILLRCWLMSGLLLRTPGGIDGDLLLFSSVYSKSTAKS